MEKLRLAQRFLLEMHGAQFSERARAFYTSEVGEMDDSTILQRIGQLVDDEHRLYSKGEDDHGLSEDEEARLRGIEVALDQCWDLLQQRRARREFGLNSDDAKVRDATTVERYDPNWKVEEQEEPRHES